MPYQSINGKIYENEHDEELSRRFGDKYEYIKYKYPEAYKLSEREIRDMADIIREAKDMKEVEEQLEAYVKENGAKFRQWYGFEYEDESKEGEPLRLSLSGYHRPDIFKKNYPGFDQDFPNVIEGEASVSVLENDCLPSRRYQKYLRDVKRNEGVGYIDNPRLIEQPTMTGISQGAYDDIRANNPEIADNYPENVKDLSDDQIDNLYCQFYYKFNHGEFINPDRIRQVILDQTTMRKPEHAVKPLQEILTAYGYPVEVDGILGSETIKALNSITDPDDFVEFAIPLLQKSMPRNPKFQNGWDDRIDRY